jgi:DNA-binding NarL/FixJ family response regulator
LLAAWFGSKNGRLPDELQEWLTVAALGDRYTERRNGSVLTVGLVAEGLTNTEIANRLWVAQSTVAKHLEQAYSKLGVHSRTAAVARLAKLSE